MISSCQIPSHMYNIPKNNIKNFPKQNKILQFKFKMGKIIKSSKLKSVIVSDKRKDQNKSKNDITTSNAAFITAKDKSQLLNKSISPMKTTSKKEKHRQKRKNLMNKFTLIKKQQKEERARKNREKTAVIGDLKPLKDALPSLDEVFKLSKEKDELKTGVREFDNSAGSQGIKKLSVKGKIKLKKDKFMRKVNSYQALLKDPDFKKNPREAIRYHIQYTNRLIDE